MKSQVQVDIFYDDKINIVDGVPQLMVLFQRFMSLQSTK